MNTKLRHLVVAVAICSVASSPILAKEGRFDRFASSLRHETLYQADENTRGALDKLIKSGNLKKILSRWDATNAKASRNYVPKPQVAENAFRAFESFFEKFKMAVITDDAQEVATMTNFPLAGAEYLFENGAQPQAAFVKAFDRLFGPMTQAVLYNKQAKDAQLDYENNTFKYRVSVLEYTVDDDTGELYESAIMFSFERVAGQFKLVGLMLAG